MARGISLTLLAASALVATAGCGSSGGDGDRYGPAGPTALFAVEPPTPGEPLRYEAGPFPDDLLVETGDDGLPSVRLAGLDTLTGRYSGLLIHGLRHLGGFGTSSAVVFPFDGDLLEASLPGDPAATTEPGSAVFLVRLGPGARVEERVAVEVHVDAVHRSLMLLPPSGRPLRPATRYAAVVTRRVRGVHPVTGAAGGVVPSAAMRALLGRGGGATGGPGLERARQLFADPLAAIVDLPDVGSTDALAAVTVFTTHDGVSEMLAVREQLRVAGPPAVRIERTWATPAELDALLGVPAEQRPGLDNPGGVAHRSLAAVATGTFDTTWYKSEPLAEDPIDVFLARLARAEHDDARWIRSPSGPVPQGTRPVPFVVVVPREPPPGAVAHPVAIFQHDLGGSRADVFAVAETLCGAGYVVVAIDAVGQGARFDPTDEQNNVTGAPGADGFADPSALSLPLGIFEGFTNALAIRDNLRQTVVDLLRLVQLLRDPALDLGPVGSPALDLDHVVLVSKSLGSIVGASFLALEPDVRVGYLSVGGGGLATELVPYSPDIGFSLPLVGLFMDIPGWCPDRHDPVLQLAQGIVDAGDPLTFARHVAREPLVSLAGRTFPPNHVALVQAIGDQTIGASSTEALARALGVALLGPTPAGGPVEGLDLVSGPAAGNLAVPGGPVTGALFRVDGVSHSMLDQQIGEFFFEPGFRHPCPTPFPFADRVIELDNPIDAVQAQLLRFLETARTGGVPELAALDDGGR